MPTIRLTQLAADKLVPPATGRIVYWDRHLPGFGMRVTAKGAKSWVAMYRVDGKPVMETIGAVAKVPKVDVARDLARASMRKPGTGSRRLGVGAAGCSPHELCNQCCSSR